MIAHITVIQQIKGYATILKYAAMYELTSIYTKVETSLKKQTIEYSEGNWNIQFYLNPPLMGNLQTI